MEEKTKLKIWVVINILLLAGLIFSGYTWFKITNTLKNPCGVCAMKNITMEKCIVFQSQLNPFGIELNLSDFTKKNNGGYAPIT